MAEFQAYIVKDDYWITITMSDGRTRQPEQDAFYAALDSIAILDTSISVTSYDFYQRGRALTLAQRYPEAITPLERAVQLEQDTRKLSLVQWRDLIDRVIESHVATGNPARAKKVLDYATHDDPAYPKFHLWLARYYASKGDLDATIASLQSAFVNKTDADSALFTNPLRDPAFKQFWKDEKFRQTIKTLKADKLP